MKEAAKELHISLNHLKQIECRRALWASEKVIRDMASLYGEDFYELMRIAGRIPEDVKDKLLSEPGLLRFVRFSMPKIPMQKVGT